VSDEKLKETAAPYLTERTSVEKSESEFQPLIDELYREEVVGARRMSLENKFLLGESLFFSACEVTLAGIRHQNPDFNEEQCQAELKRRLKLREWMDWNE